MDSEAPQPLAVVNLCSHISFWEPEVMIEVLPAAGAGGTRIPSAALSTWGHDKKRPSAHPAGASLE